MHKTKRRPSYEKLFFPSPSTNLFKKNSIMKELRSCNQEDVIIKHEKCIAEPMLNYLPVQSKLYLALKTVGPCVDSVLTTRHEAPDSSN